MVHAIVIKQNTTGIVPLHDVHYMRLQWVFSHGITDIGRSYMYAIDAFSKAKGMIDFWEHFRPKTYGYKATCNQRWTGLLD